MSARTVRVHLHNETGESLVLVSSSLEDGEWTPHLPPPQRIAPGTVAMFRSESSGFIVSEVSGTEGRAVYAVGGDTTRQLYVHWNNPLLGSNVYHVNTDDSHYAFWAGGRGNDATVEFVIREARLVTTRFTPQFDGFHFRNHWENTPYTPPFLRGTPLEAARFGNANNGLCGGMVYLAMDYFLSNQAIPAQTTPPQNEQDRMFVNLVDRLFDTYTLDSVSLMLKLMDPIYPDGDENVLSVLDLAAGRAAVMANQEWPLIRADIDRGMPSPLTIITVKSLWPGDLGKHHQVLVYAYEAHAHHVVLHIYDPNQPDMNDITMSFDDGDVSHRIVVDHNIKVSGRPIYCFIRMEYGFKQPYVPTGPWIPHPPTGRPGVAPSPELRLESVQQIMALAEEQHGRRLFDVLPDCGQKEFDYTVTRQRVRIQLHAIVENFAGGEVHWSIEENSVPSGVQTFTVPRVEPVDMLVPQTKNYTLVDDPDQPLVSSLKEVPLLPEVHDATITTTLNGDRLTIDARPEDGAYYLNLRVGVRDPVSSIDRRWYDSRLRISGRTELVFGLAEAQDQCLGRWLRGLMVEAPTEEQIIAAAYAQLGRPLDPIWDPDPVLLPPDAWVALSDPAEDPDFATLEPFTTEPGTAEPGTAEPGTAEPGTAEPGTAEPGTAEPGTAEPGTAEPGTAEPGTAEPGTAEPGTAEPGTAEPGTAEPGTAEPGTAEPGTAEPGTAEPGTAEPGTAEPGTAEPGTAEPGTAEPGTTEPGEAVVMVSEQTDQDG